MNDPMTDIDTSAEIAENAFLPTLYEVHAGETKSVTTADVPANMGQGEAKSPARWAYERLALYIKKFEETLNADQEIAMGFAGSDAGVLRIEGMGYFDPDILTFYGETSDGARTQLVQHVSQLSMMLKAMPKQSEKEEPTRIGFELMKSITTSG